MKIRGADLAVSTGQPNLGKANLTWLELSTGQNGQARDHGAERA